MATFKSEDFREAVRNILQDYQKEYQSIAQPVVEKIIQDIQTGKSLVKAVSDALSETSFFDANKEATVNAIYLAACAGYGVLPKLVVNSEKIKNTLLSDAWTGDDMPLSKRLHGTTPLMRESIVTTIRKSMLAAQTVKDMAINLYDGYNSGKTVIQQAELPQYLKKIEMYARWAADGDMQMAQTILALSDDIKKKINMGKTPNLRTAYSELVNACKTFSVETINKAVHTALEEKLRYHAERIARTESARAWFDGFIAKNQNDSDVWGYRWVLSSRHALVPFDQCDVCANMNVGFGKGVYPKNKVPSIPRHPHCMCMLQVIYVWEVKADQEFQPKKAREYIDALPEGKQQQLFGKAGVEAYHLGSDWEKILRGWDGFNKPQSRLNKKYFDKHDPHNAGEGDIINLEGVESLESLEQSKKRDHKIFITDIAIDKVGLVEVDGFSEEQKILLQEAHQSVLKTAKDHNKSNEVLGIYKVDFAEHVQVLGSRNSVNPGRNPQAFALVSTSRERELLYIHNHPNTTNLSLADIMTFISYGQIKIMSVVTNQGEIYLLNKTQKYAYNRIRELFSIIYNKYEDEVYTEREAINEFLSVCSEGGVEYGKSK
ncbi:hypothetical protein SAMN05660742_10685 [Propionispira arboris]|uniref:Phage Mu protein F like protein n=1 Tax=Propionispira arboris TaxID=84035 RepID=A0A1H6Y2L9_9FIRM|nr:hypothetical protein [Propionispira arboris]SEJ35491.1 hypothetical protein SAMN05660742_10685 [Propionispira arboris]